MDVYQDEAGTRRQVSALTEGNFFGEAALITGEPRNATVIAKEDVDLYVLGKAEFRAALDGSEGFREQLLKIFFQRK